MRGWWALVLLAGCQLPPDQVVGWLPDLLVEAGDLTSLPDLTPPPPPPDLSLADLTPPALGGNQLVIDPNAAMASLVFNVTDGDTRLPTPARVIFLPSPGKGFADNLHTGFYEPNTPGSATGAIVGPGVLGAPEGVMLVTGLGTVPVPPGQYQLFITRGPEYEAVELVVDLQAGEVERVDAELDHSVDTRGWLSADMHVHTKGSFDSQMPFDRRVISMATNGVELIVTTEHNGAVDLAPMITALGYGRDLIGSLIGDEFNFDPGHGGAYPVAYDANLPAGGVPMWIDPCVPGVGVQCTSAADMFDRMHASIPGVTAVTINHPWWGGGDLGYFTNVGWGAGTGNPLPATLSTAGKFDGIEVINGYWTNVETIAYLTADWMFLLSQGHRVTALGNSDTHKINWVSAGWPRSWLRLPTDLPGEVSGAQLGEAVRQQRAIASTGPFAELIVDGKPIGDTVVPAGASVTVEMRVDAPSWIQVETVRLYKNGQLAHEYAVPAGQRPVFHKTIQEPMSGDGWFALSADGSKPLRGDVVGEYAHFGGWETRPFVLTNPVFVDGNNDGQWQPPTWSGAPKPFNRASTRPLDDRVRLGAVPEGCGPNEVEPPLDSQSAAERYLAPLVNP